MVRQDLSKPVRRPNRDRREYDEFRESVAAPIPNRTYRSEVDLIDSRPSAGEQLIRYVAVLLSFFIAVRFLISLFTSSRVNPLVNFFYSITDWAVRPFQYLFGMQPTGTGGFFDWAALAALVAVAGIASLLIALLRPRRL